MEARPLVAAYLDELTHQRRASVETLSAYRRDLELLLARVGERPVASVAAMDIRRFVGQLHAQGLSGRSIARTLSAWRGFFRWLSRRHGLNTNPCELVRPPKSKHALPASLSPEQASAMLDAQADSMLEQRDKAMFELFYSSGLRLSELAGLDYPGGVDLDAGMVTVTGKRAKTRTVPVGTDALLALRTWLTERASLAAPDEVALFVSRRGTRLSTESIGKRLDRWARKHGLPIHVHPHMLRHSFASHVLQSSGDLRAVQEMLGHSSIASTQVYTHLDFQHLAKVYDAAHPRARKK